MKATMASEKEVEVTTGKARVQFDFGKESLRKLDELVENVGAVTRAELIRRAIIIYSEILEAEARGAKVLFREKDGTLVQFMTKFQM